MSEDDVNEDVEFFLARISALRQAKRELQNMLDDDLKYVGKVLGERDLMNTERYTVERKTFQNKRAMGLKEIENILGEEIAQSVTKVSENTRIYINEVIDVEPFEIKPGDLVPDYVRAAIKGVPQEKKDEE